MNRTLSYITPFVLVVSISSYAADTKKPAAPAATTTAKTTTTPPPSNTVDCGKYSGVVTTRATACITGQKNYDARFACIKKIDDGTIPSAFFNGACVSVLDGLKATFMAKEKSLYPTQPSAIQAATSGNGGPNNGPNNAMINGPSVGMNNGSTISPADCSKWATTIKGKVESCFNSATYDVRFTCVNSIPNDPSIPQGVFNGSCTSQLDPLRAQLITAEKNRYPKQNSALEAVANGRNGQNNGPSVGMNNGPNNGMNNGPNMGMNNGLSPADCSKWATTIKGKVESCFNSATYDIRFTCINSIPNDPSIPQGVFNGSCTSQLDPLRAQLITAEKNKYPKQNSALEAVANRNNGNGPNNGTSVGMNNGPGGNNNGMNNGPAMSSADCTKWANTIQARVEGCFASNTYDARFTCINMIPQDPSIPQSVFSGSCSAQLDPMKNRLVSVEKSKYPSQASALDAVANSRGGQGPNNGPNNARMPSSTRTSN